MALAQGDEPAPAPTQPPAKREPRTLAHRFSLATCNELIRHRKRRPHLVQTEHTAWTIKQMDTFFCVDAIERINARRILEIGAGWQTQLDAVLGSKREYWAVDKVGFYPKDRMDAAAAERKHTRWVDAFMGEFSAELPDDYFHVVFSISVLEHVPPSEMSHVCGDMFRVLRPGGYSVHSIDASVSGISKIGPPYLRAFREAGFELDCQPRLTFELGVDAEASLLEPLLNTGSMAGAGGGRTRGPRRRRSGTRPARFWLSLRSLVVRESERRRLRRA